MRKKLLSLAAASAMALTALSGCTPEDVALFKAMQKTPESSVTTTRTTFDVSLEEPFYFAVDGEAMDGDGSAEANYIMQVTGGLLSLSQVEEVVKKSGNQTESLSTYTLPDASVSFKSWTETDGLGQTSKVIASIPSYVKPFLPAALSKKQYFSFGSIQELLGGSLFGAAMPMNGAYLPETQDDVSLAVIGGADGPTSVYTAGGTPAALHAGLFVNALPVLLRNEEFIDAAANVLDTKLVQNTVREGRGTVYTVVLNGETLKSILTDTVNSLGKDEVASSIGMNEDDIAGLRTISELCGGFIADSGLFDKGITIKYTVDADGYIVRTETDMDMTLDMEKYMGALAKSTVQLISGAVSDDGEPLSDDELREATESVAEEMAAMNIGGRFRISAKQVSEVTDINRPVAVSFPELTDENSIDIMKDINDYAAYTAAKSQWEELWNDSYHEVSDYGNAHQSGDPLVIRNADTGAEVTTVPITTADVYPDEDDGFMSMYMPLTDVANVLPGITHSWNGELMGVEVSYTKANGERSYTLYPTETGAELYLNAVYGEDGNSENTDTVYSKFDYVDTYGLYYNDIFYVEYDMFNRDLGYVSRFDDGKYCYTAAKNAEFDYGSIEGNLIYELENMFQ